MATTTTTTTRNVTEEEDNKKDKESPPSTSDQQEQEPKPFSQIPGPWPSIPFFGTTWLNLLRSFVGQYSMHKLHDVYHGKYLTYGPIYREYLTYSMPIVHIFDPEDMKTLFYAQGRCPIRPPNEFEVYFRKSQPERYPNVGLPHLNGEQWLKHRKNVAPSITTLRLINDNFKSQSMISKDFIDFLWHLRDPATNIVANVQEATYRLSLESICNLCLNHRLGALDIVDYDPEKDRSNYADKTDGEIMIDATKTMFEAFNSLYHGFPWWKVYRTGPYEHMEQSEEAIYDIANKYVEIMMAKLSKEPGEKSTVLENLLNNDELNEDDVKLAVIDFIVGGISTISIAFAFLFHHLAANPHVQEKLYEEIQSVIQNKRDSSGSGQNDSDDPGSISCNDLAQMSYLKACVQENFRITCVVPGNTRITVKPIVLSGYSIPTGTLVYAHTATTCRLEKYFKNALQYRPERWLIPEEKDSIHPFALLAFGYGKRMCPGKRFAESVLHLSVAYLVKNFKLELANKGEEIGMKHVFMVMPANPVAVRLIRR